jgi:hypothetical protein
MGSKVTDRVNNEKLVKRKILSTKPIYMKKGYLIFFSLVAVILIIGALLVYRVFFC